MTGVKIEEAFKISIIGYKARTTLLDKDTFKNDQKKKIDIYSLLNQITGMDDASIIAACKACTYDVWLRNPAGAMLAKGAEEITPDNITIENVLLE